MRQVLEAVAYLHSLKIVHRNLKVSGCTDTELKYSTPSVSPLPHFQNPAFSVQLENLVYFNRLKHSKIVISDFQLAKLEHGLIKDPCGTPEYLGRSLENVEKVTWVVNTVEVETVLLFFQLRRWLRGRDTADLWTAGLSASLCIYCKNHAGPSPLLLFLRLVFHNIFIHQLVRKPSVLRRRRRGGLGQSWQEPLPEDSVRGLWVWLAVLGWHFRFWWGL